MLRDAQLTMRQNYINGGPGVFVSGLAWLVSASIAYVAGFQTGMIALFLGGMLIVPVSALLEKRMKGDAPEPDKAMTRLAVFTLPLLFGGLFIAYTLSARNPSWFYEIMAVAIGLRYLVFSRIYGLRAFIGLGALLILIGVLAYALSLPLLVAPLLVGIVEIASGVFLCGLDPGGQFTRTG